MGPTEATAPSRPDHARSSDPTRTLARSACQTTKTEQDDAVPIPGPELTAALKAASTLRRLLKRPPPAAVLRLRAARREEIRNKLGKSAEVVIVNHKKWNDYPNPDKRRWPRGASDWYKREVKGCTTGASRASPPSSSSRSDAAERSPWNRTRRAHARCGLSSA